MIYINYQVIPLQMYNHFLISQLIVDDFKDDKPQKINNRSYINVFGPFITVFPSGVKNPPWVGVIIYGRW